MTAQRERTLTIVPPVVRRPPAPRSEHWGAGRRYLDLIRQGVPKLDAARQAIEESQIVLCCVTCEARVRFFEADPDGWQLDPHPVCPGCLDDLANELRELA
jgi:hypothetical protein